MRLLDPPPFLGLTAGILGGGHVHAADLRLARLRRQGRQRLLLSLVLDLLKNVFAFLHLHFLLDDFREFGIVTVVFRFLANVIPVSRPGDQGDRGENRPGDHSGRPGVLFGNVVALRSGLGSGGGEPIIAGFRGRILQCLRRVAIFGRDLRRLIHRVGRSRLPDSERVNLQGGRRGVRAERDHVTRLNRRRFEGRSPIHERASRAFAILNIPLPFMQIEHAMAARNECIGHLHIRVRKPSDDQRRFKRPLR